MNEIEFPENVIQGLAKEFADTYSNFLESPWEFWAFSHLTSLGNLLAPYVTLHSSLSVLPRLYTVLLGESADDRKSECIKQTKALFSEAFPKEFHPCETVGSGEALIQRLEKFPNTLLIYDELQAFFEKARIPRSILFECANTLFEENRIQSHTKDRQIEVNSGYLSILGASTIDTFMNMWNLKAAEMGFLNRLWLVQARAEKRFSISKPIPEEKKTYLKDKLIRLFNDISSKGVTAFKLTNEARAVFDDWYENSKDSIYSKRPGQGKSDLIQFTDEISAPVPRGVLMLQIIHEIEHLRTQAELIQNTVTALKALVNRMIDKQVEAQYPDLAKYRSFWDIATDCALNPNLQKAGAVMKLILDKGKVIRHLECRQYCPIVILYFGQVLQV